MHCVLIIFLNPYPIFFLNPYPIFFKCLMFNINNKYMYLHYIFALLKAPCFGLKKMTSKYNDPVSVLI